MCVCATVANAIWAQSDTIPPVAAQADTVVTATPQVSGEGSLAKQAAAAYEADDFQLAITLYDQLAATEGTSSDLFYNMGNTYYRLGRMGEAIQYYERALALDPGNENARSNLEFVNGRLHLVNDSGATFFSDTISDFVKRVASNTWGWIGVVCFLLFLVAVALYIFSQVVSLRKIGFFGGGLLLLLAVLANICAFYTHSSNVSHDYAVITVPSVTLSTSPRAPKDKSEEAFMLNEGTKVEIVDSVASAATGEQVIWYDVKADDEHRAWVNGGAIGKI